MRIKTSPYEESELRACDDRIKAALAALDEAEAKVAKLSRTVADARTALGLALSALDPHDAAAVDAVTDQRGRFETLAAKLASEPCARSAALALRSALFAAEEPIRNCSQKRSVEEGLLSQCTWLATLHAVSAEEPGAQVRHLRSIASQVTADLNQILSCRRGMLLTLDERRDGVLNDINRRRRLTPAEAAAGVANE